MAVSSRQRDQSKRKHGHLSSHTYAVEFWGGECRHWSEKIEKKSRDVEGQRYKQGWRWWWRWNRGMQSYRKFDSDQYFPQNECSHIFNLCLQPLFAPQPIYERYQNETKTFLYLWLDATFICVSFMRWGFGLKEGGVNHLLWNGGQSWRPCR